MGNYGPGYWLDRLETLDLPALTEALQFGNYTELEVERPSQVKPSEYLKVDDVGRIYHLLHREEHSFLSDFW